jgi:hypothetical protein
MPLFNYANEAEHGEPIRLNGGSFCVCVELGVADYATEVEHGEPLRLNTPRRRN